MEDESKIDNQIFRSHFGIGQQVYYSIRSSIVNSEIVHSHYRILVKIIAVTFTKTGEFYDVMDESDNTIYNDIKVENINKT